MISFLDLEQVNRQYRAEISEAMSRVLDSGWYIRGQECKRFEHNYASYIGSKWCIGVGNGLDALSLIYRAYIEMGIMAPGDEVIVPANTYIASILAITENQLVPVLVEPCLDTLEIDEDLIERAITPRTRSVMIVHLYGRCAYTKRIGNLCKEHGLKLVEDNAQAHGCRYIDGEETALLPRTGSLGDAAGHSFYPGKNMGALGDGGAVTTNDEQLAETIRSMSNYGSAEKYVFQFKGVNSRLDELQAAILDVKLRHLDEDNRHRQMIADYYYEHLGKNSSTITLPQKMLAGSNVYHLFPIFCERRDELQAYLREQGVQTMVHYPIPPHRQQCYSSMKGIELPITEKIHRQELSLPMSQVLSLEDAKKVVEAVNNF